MQNHITCPKCRHEINVEAVLSEQIEASLQVEWNRKNAEFIKREQALKDAQQLIDAQVQQKVQLRETQLRSEAKIQAKNEYENQLSDLLKEVDTKSQKISEMSKREADLMRQQRELNEAKASVRTEIEKGIALERTQLQAQAAEKAMQEAQLTLQEKDLLIGQLKDQMTDMQRKMQQGSMQVQGEAQELALETLLRQAHASDLFEEIKKGELGADLAHTVRNPFGKLCGQILYESKRTQHFSEEWITKLKHDMQLRKADIGVIVTQALPKGVTQFELREGNIYICSPAALQQRFAAIVEKIEGQKATAAAQAEASEALGFDEFLQFRGFARSQFEHTAQQPFSEPIYQIFRQEYETFLRFGGFPEVVLAETSEDKTAFLKDIINAYIELDIKLLSDFRVSNDLYKLCQLLASRTGSRLDISKLSSISGINRNKLTEYMALFEYTYFIHLIPSFTKNKDREIAAQRKVYIADTGMLQILAQVSSGQVFENAVALQLLRLGEVAYYQKKSGQKIDFILNKDTAIEV